MELWELLGVRPGVTALIGGGGKTTAMYVLARELVKRGTVVCTTTTRILPPDHLPVLLSPGEEAVSAALADHGCACLGTPAENGKLFFFQSGKLYPVHNHFPLVGNVHSADHIQQCCLTRTGSTDHRGKLPLFNRKIDPVKRPDLFFSFSKIFLQMTYCYNIHCFSFFFLLFSGSGEQIHGKYRALPLF